MYFFLDFLIRLYVLFKLWSCFTLLIISVLQNIQSLSTVDNDIGNGGYIANRWLNLELEHSTEIFPNCLCDSGLLVFKM